MQLFFHGQQTLLVILIQLGQGNAGHLGDGLSNHLRIHIAAALGRLFLPFPPELFLLIFKLVRLVPQVGRALKILLGDRLFLFPVEALDLLFKILQIRRTSHRFHSQPGTSLIDHVDRLVGKKSP